MKVHLEYDPECYDDIQKAKSIINSDHNQEIVDCLYDVLIRPYYKHGFLDSKVNKILEDLGDDGEYLMNHFADCINKLKGE